MIVLFEHSTKQFPILQRMRWSCLGTKWSSSNISWKPSCFDALVSGSINLISTQKCEICQLQSYYEYNSSSFAIEYPKITFSNSQNDSADNTKANIDHAKAVKDGSIQLLQVANYVLSLYVRFRNTNQANKLLEEIPNRNVRTWTIFISGFVQKREAGLALELFRSMQREGVYPNQFTLSSILKCCSYVNDVQMGKGIHGWILRRGIELDTALENSILDYYSKCQAFDYAKRLFELMTEKDTLSWNIIIGAYLQSGDIEKSLDLFELSPFKDITSWNSMLTGQMRNGFERNALELLYEMVKIKLEFNRLTFSIALALVSSLLILELGRQIHGHIFRLGTCNNEFVSNSLINMYCKCGEMEKALAIFRNMHLGNLRMQNSNIFSWSPIVSGFIQNGRSEDALKFFRFMIHERFEVDKFTLTSIVSACANIGILELGRQTHAYIQKIGHKLDSFFCSSLIDMYSKCGSLDDAWLTFGETNKRNNVIWTSMIYACALHGQAKEAIRVFEMMIHEGTTPNEVTFVGVLTACSHSGLLDEGLKYFRLMKEAYSLEPKAEHFTCVVDLFGRAGRLNEAEEFIYKNGISHLSSIWNALLSSCRIHKNTEMGMRCSDKLFNLDPSAAGSYILLSNICGASNRWDEGADVRNFMREKGVKKQPARSWIQIRDRVHTFFMGDRSHEEKTQIYTFLEKLIGRLKEFGYSNDVKMVMQDVEEEQREILLGFHSEKLAVVYGIISTNSEMPIRVMKNLRICIDCHNFMKFTSQVLCREIIVRDIRRFHHFKHGCCSCGDYW